MKTSDIVAMYMQGKNLNEIASIVYAAKRIVNDKYTFQQALTKSAKCVIKANKR